VLVSRKPSASTVSVPQVMPVIHELKETISLLSITGVAGHINITLTYNTIRRYYYEI
jgi:hypothetical protein